MLSLCEKFFTSQKMALKFFLGVSRLSSKNDTPSINNGKTKLTDMFPTVHPLIAIRCTSITKKKKLFILLQYIKDNQDFIVYNQNKQDQSHEISVINGEYNICCTQDNIRVSTVYYFIQVQKCNHSR